MYVSCAVCGLRIKGHPTVYSCNDRIFSVLQELSSKQNESWRKNASPGDKELAVCSICTKVLRKKVRNIPKFSRANIPLPEPVPELQDLSFVEQMLISPVLPMVCLRRYKTFGQYQSKGQCIVFYNRVQEIAEVLPRTLSEVVVNIKDTYRHSDISIHVQRLRTALLFLKEHHPAYETIEISEKNLEQIKHNIEKHYETPNPPFNQILLPSSDFSDDEALGKATDVEPHVRHAIDMNCSNAPVQAPTAAESVRNIGQNQVVEEQVA